MSSGNRFQAVGETVMSHSTIESPSNTNIANAPVQSPEALKPIVLIPFLSGDLSERSPESCNRSRTREVGTSFQAAKPLRMPARQIS